MEHYKESQYDDDLTVGIGDYDEDFTRGDLDLFDYMGDDDSPLARLKSLILSIDWEITDDILRQFNEELVDLKETWKGEKINLIYVQAMEKISKYIFKEKSSAHPNAIKLLLTLYTNLEKVVSDESLSASEKKEILYEDVQRFERLKKAIAPSSSKASKKSEEPPAPAGKKKAKPAAAGKAEDSPAAMDFDEFEDAGPLKKLKAIVYGIDWEVTDSELDKLGKEVSKLQEEFKGSKVKLIFLQGIGSLGSYISMRKSNSHGDAFKLLHSLYAGLEKIVCEGLSGQAEKDVLLPEIEKFNAFKEIMAEKPTEADDDFDDGDMEPAFSDVPGDEQGFLGDDEDEAPAGGEISFLDDGDEEDSLELASEMESRLDGMFDEPTLEEAKNLAADIALEGVNVEMDADDDSEEEPLPLLDGEELAPALSTDDDLIMDEESPAVFADQDDEFMPDEEGGAMVGQSLDEGAAFEMPALSEAKGSEPEVAAIGGPIPGVDVETEDDDDSGEEPLMMDGDEFAPALSGPEESGDHSLSFDEETPSEEISEVDSNLDAFFGADDVIEEISDDVEEEVAAEEAKEDVIAKESKEDVVAEESPAFEFEEEPQLEMEMEQSAIDSDVEDKLSSFFGEEDADMSAAKAAALAGVDVETDDDDDSEEMPLDMDGDEFAPALGAEDDEVALTDGFDDGFDEPPAGDFLSEEGPVALESVEDEVEELDEDIALFDEEETVLALDEDDTEEEIDSAFAATFDETEETEVAEEFEFEASADEEEFLFEDADDEVEVAEEAGEEGEFADLLADYDGKQADMPVLDDEEDIFGEGALASALDGSLEVEDEIETIDEDELIVVEAGKPGFVGQQGQDDVLAMLGGDSSAFDETEGQHVETLTLEDHELIQEPIGGAVTDDGFLGTAGDDEEFSAGLVDAKEDDDVVFEAAEEDFADADTYSSELLAEGPIASQSLDEELDEELNEMFQSDTGDDAAYIAPLQNGSGESGALAGLRNAIVGIDAAVGKGSLQSLTEALEGARGEWLHRPTEKTYVQLLTTIVGHIEKHGGEADAQSGKLLHSVFDKLELCALGQEDAGQVQESLLAETSKVLQWQQQLIDRSAKTVGRGGDAIGAPIPDEQELASNLEDISQRIDSLGDDILMQKMSSVMKSELEQLRKAFQAELKQLREEISKGH